MTNDSWPLTTKSFVEKLKSEDSETWLLFNNNYRPIIKSICQHKLKFNDADAEDVTQDVSLSVKQSIRAFEFDRKLGRFRAWVSDITYKRAADFRRKQNSQNKHLENLPDEELLQVAQSAFDTFFTETFELTVFVDCIGKVVRLLDAQGKTETFSVYELLEDGTRAAEIARQMSKSTDWVYRQRRIVYDLLEQIMERDYGEIIRMES